MLCTVSRLVLVNFLAFAVSLLVLGGCALIPRKAVTPLETVEYPWLEGERQSRLLVFLPGRFDMPDDFDRRGMLDEFKAAGMPADVVAVDAHLGYYLNKSVAERLHREILQPARSSGYEKVWVVGNSLGGLGALFTERVYPGSWDKMFLLAPFLGNDKQLFQEIEEAGGFLDWQPRPVNEDDEFTRLLWTWLKDFHGDLDERPELFIGYGQQDKLASSIELLAEHLPPERVLRVEGGHKWVVWRPLWKRILQVQ